MDRLMKPELRTRERGIALLIVLFATLLLTVIGLGMMYSTNMETAINNNYRDSQVALYGALSGLQQARQRIKYPYDITPPLELPSLDFPNIIYIVSDASVVKPWEEGNAYFDTELCQENILDLDPNPGVPCTETADGDDWREVVDNASSSTWNLGSTLSFKWARIQLKANNNTPVPVNGDATDNSQACWDGIRQLSTPSNYTTGCQPIGGVTSVNLVAGGTGYASAPTVTLTGGGGTGATATATMVAETTGVVDSITIGSGGAYETVPTVTISGNATGIAVLGTTGTTNVTGGAVTSAAVTAGGTGYTISPTVTITGGGGSGATATANLSATGLSTVTGGTVTAVNVTAGGSLYTTAPTVTFSGGSGSGATGTANMVSDGTGIITGGSVTGTTLTAGGTGYTSAPTVVFSGGGGGSGASATAVLSSTGTTVTSGTVSALSLSNAGSSYTSAPTVSFTSASGTGAAATAVLSNSGTIASVAVSNAGNKCYSTASDAVVAFTGGGGGTGAAASAVLDTSRSCIYAISVTASPQCTNKLDASNGYSPIDQKSGLTLTAGNQSFSGTLYVSTANDKSPESVTVQNPGYDTSGYSSPTFNTTFRLSGGAWADCGNITAAVTTGYRIASITVTNPGSGYLATPGVTVTGGVGSTNPTATATRSFPVASLSLTAGGSGYTSAPTLAFSGGGGSGAAATSSITTTSTTTYPVAGINLVSGGSGYLTTPTITLTGGGGNGAAGTVSVTHTGTTTYSVASVTITGGGTGYTSAPSISFTGDGSGAAATADITTTSLTTYEVASITITSGGVNYTSVPTITLSGGSGSGAAATAAITTTSVTTYPVASITITSDGDSYTAAPTVTLTGGGGTGGGTATATIAQEDTGFFSIQSFSVTAQGSGYSSNPTVTLDTGGGPGSGGEGQAQISGGTKFGKVWLITALAVTGTGARSMLQMEVASPVLGFGSGGALTLDGPSPIIDAMPNSMNFFISGEDASNTAGGCGEPPQDDHPAIDGFDDPNANPATHSVEDIIDALPDDRLDHYIGAGGTPSVQNGYGALGETMTTPAGMDAVMAAIYNTPGAHHYNSSNVNTFNVSATVNSSINYVDADLTLNGNGTGRGILIVTRTLTMSGNFTWYGIIFVVGDGNVQMNGGGNGQIRGSIWVAKTWDNHTDKNLLQEMGSPTFGWNGGGGNGVQYDHCYVDNLLTAVSLDNVNSTRPLKALSYRALPY